MTGPRRTTAPSPWPRRNSITRNGALPSAVTASPTSCTATMWGCLSAAVIHPCLPQEGAQLTGRAAPSRQEATRRCLSRADTVVGQDAPVLATTVSLCAAGDQTGARKTKQPSRSERPAGRPRPDPRRPRRRLPDGSRRSGSRPMQPDNRLDHELSAPAHRSLLCPCSESPAGGTRPRTSRNRALTRADADEKGWALQALSGARYRHALGPTRACEDSPYLPRPLVWPPGSKSPAARLEIGGGDRSLPTVRGRRVGDGGASVPRCGRGSRR
jgi:hypothetical protein